jgi:hypothetical protein
MQPITNFDTNAKMNMTHLDKYEPNGNRPIYWNWITSTLNVYNQKIMEEEDKMRGGGGKHTLFILDF